MKQKRYSEEQIIYALKQGMQDGKARIPGDPE
jgi:hypothetical protein